MDDQIRLARISPRTVESLYQGASACFPDVFYGANFEPEKHPVALFWGTYDRTSFGELLTDVTYPFTKSRTIEEAVKKIQEWRRLLEDGKYPEATVPDKLNELVEEYEQRKEELAKNEEQRLRLAQEFKAVADKAREIREAEEKLASQPAPLIKEPKIIPATRVFLKPEPPLIIPQITSADIEEIKTLIETAKKNPTVFSENLAKKLVQEYKKAIPKAISDDIIRTNSQQVSLNFTDKLIGLDPNEDLFPQLSYLYSQNPIHVIAGLAGSTKEGFFKSIPDTNQARQTAEAGQGLSLILENDHSVAKTFLSPVFKNREVLEIFYPGAESLINFNISSQKDEQTTHEIDLLAFQNSYQRVLDTNSQFIDQIKGNVWGEVKKQGLNSLDKALSNTPWYQKSRPLLERFIPGFGAKEISLNGSFFRFQPGLASLWTAKSVPLFTTNLTGILNTSFSNNILLTPVFNFRLGSFVLNRAVFTTTEGLTGQVFGVSLGNFGITLSRVATEKGTQFAINIGAGAAVESATKAAGAAAVKAAATTAVSTAAKTGIKTVLSTAFKAVVSSVGEIFGGPLGHLATWLATEGVTRLVSKIWRWIKRHKEDFVIVPLALLSLGLVIGGAIGSFLIGGALITGVGYGAMMAGGIQPAGSLLAQGGQSFIFALTHVALPAIGVPVITALISIPIAVAIILFIINSGAYIVPPGGVTDVPGGPPGPIECTAEKTPISFPNNSGSSISKRAWEITSDLYQGFWCYWNRSPGDFPTDKTDYPPSYPDLFDEDLFAGHPNPTRDEVSSCGECLFWCTWLVQKAYRENGVSIAYTLWSPTMQDDFTRRGKFISANEATPDNVSSGSVVFFDVDNSLDRTDHVGIAHSVNVDGVVFVQSNAPTKEGLISFNSSGIGLQDIPGIKIVGVGLP